MLKGEEVEAAASSGESKCDEDDESREDRFPGPRPAEEYRRAAPDDGDLDPPPPPPLLQVVLLPEQLPVLSPRPPLWKPTGHPTHNSPSGKHVQTQGPRNHT